MTPQLTLLSREECGLCEEMLEALTAFSGARSLALTVRDVDSDPELRRRFGHKVPVLLLDGEPVCHGRFDAEELTRLLRPR